VAYRWNEGVCIGALTIGTTESLGLEMGSEKCKRGGVGGDYIYFTINRDD